MKSFKLDNSQTAKQQTKAAGGLLIVLGIATLLFSFPAAVCLILAGVALMVVSASATE